MVTDKLSLHRIEVRREEEEALGVEGEGLDLGIRLREDDELLPN